MEEFDKDQSIRTEHTEWHWQDFDRQNNVTLDFFESKEAIEMWEGVKNGKRLKILDIVELTKLRPDGHESGLHYRKDFPSVTTTWNWILYNILLTFPR